MTRHPPATSATASNAKTTHTTATSPTSAIRHNAKQTSMPVCRRIRAARAAMPASAMTALGGPITPRKHIQASQDAAAMNASRGGSAARASKNRQMGNVVRKARRGGRAKRECRRRQSNGMGVGMCCPVRQRGAPPCGRETTRSRIEITSGKFGQRGCPKQKPPARGGRQGKCLMRRPCLGNGARLHRYQIAGSAVRTPSPRASVFAEPMGDRADGAAGDG